MKLRKKYLKRIRGLLIIAFIIITVALIFQHLGEVSGMENNRTGVSIMSRPNIIRNLNLKYRGIVRAGDTLEKILNNEPIFHTEISNIIAAVKGVFDVKNIRAGNTFIVEYDGSGVKRIIYHINYRSYLLIEREQTGFQVSKVQLRVRTEFTIVKGVIKESLFHSILKIGEKGKLADLLATLFEYDVDFNRDIREGDSFEILIAKRFVKGDFVGYGPLVAAKFTNRGETIKIIRFEYDKGKYSYFHPDGRAVKKMFLRCPLPFMRVTSRFGFRRHPVLGFSASHNGVDFGAPRGTIVRASSDGIIFKTGYTSVKGRYIIISHRNNYRSHYYHLSGIKRGVRRGRRVTQGEVIGYVGTTGRSTGPHLHYGIQRGGRFINPLRLRSPSKRSVPDGIMNKFRLYKDIVFSLMDESNENYFSQLLLKGFIRLTNGFV